jgi:hypothetical protein
MNYYVPFVIIIIILETQENKWAVEQLQAQKKEMLTF